MADPRKQQYNFNKLQKRLRHNIGQAIGDYSMIEENDVVMVCVSGGKDSYVLLDILRNLQRSAPVGFRIIAVHLNQMLPGYPDGLIEKYLSENNYEYKIVTENVTKIVADKMPEGNNFCSLCSRLRRGILYRTASEIGATKIALGHHREDLLETMFLNMFFNGKIKSMPPKLVTDDHKHIVIRPLVYCAEKDLRNYSAARQYPIISGDLCSRHANQQRAIIKEMLNTWEKQYPGRTEILAKSLKDISPSHMMDPKLFDFRNLSADEAVTEENIIPFTAV